MLRLEVFGKVCNSCGGSVDFLPGLKHVDTTSSTCRRVGGLGSPYLIIFGKVYMFSAGLRVKAQNPHPAT